MSKASSATSSPILAIIIRIEAATCRADLFPADSSDADKEYTRIAKLIHPDKLRGESPAIQERGERAFKTMGAFFAGNKKVASTPPVFGSWVVEAPLCAGDLADLYQVTSVKIPKAVLKIARNANDNDLLEAEVAQLKKLHAGLCDGDYFQRFIPKVLDSFKASGRRAVVLTFAEDELRRGGMEPLTNLAEVLKLNGKLDFRHTVWISNRILNTMGYWHRQNIVHGSIIPPHIMIGPETHTARIVDWCYSIDAEVKPGAVIAAISNDYKRFYPKEVFAKRNALPVLDIYMWARTVQEISLSVPKQFTPLLEWCTTDSPKARPRDAWEVQKQWSTLAAEVYGKPTYIKLELKRT